MLRTVYLHGEAGRLYGRRWRLDVDTLAEAIRAIGVQVKGFQQYVEARDWRCVRGRALKGGYELDEAQVGLRLGDADLHISPVIAGAGGKMGGSGKIIAGVLLAGFAFFMPGAFGASGIFGGLGLTAKQVGMVGVAMALQGVSSLISAQKKSEKESHVFSNIQDVAVQGTPVPLLVGKYRCRDMPIIYTRISTTKDAD